MKENKELIMCNCCQEGIVLTAMPEFKTIELGIWSFGRYHGSMSFWSRIKLIYLIAIKGYPWSDDIILDEGAAKRLIDSLCTAISEINNG